MRRLQQLAIACAFLGVALLTWEGGEFPWLAVAVAVSFSSYGIIRKQVPVDGLIGLAVETIVLLPVASIYLAQDLAGPSQSSGLEDAETLFKLALSGIVTAIPLLCFGQAARRLPVSTLGFMQYISPSVQFLLAVYLFGEQIKGSWLSYVLVWTALAIFSLDSYRWYRRQKWPGMGAPAAPSIKKLA